jgi:TPP-dependent pyruvate/acetoin dehydrogenase alpha subunit
MFALDLLTVEQFFAQIYAHADREAEPFFGGRSMTGHFATRLLDDKGNFLPQTDRYNSAADLSPTASQMPRLVGLAYASKLYRRMPEIREQGALFSSDGNEVVFGTIGNAGCAEGLFWEAVNAVGVLQVPMLLSVWDDGFGISVPNAFQMTKGDILESSKDSSTAWGAVPASTFTWREAGTIRNCVPHTLKLRSWFAITIRRRSST